MYRSLSKKSRYLYVGVIAWGRNMMRDSCKKKLPVSIETYIREMPRNMEKVIVTTYSHFLTECLLAVSFWKLSVPYGVRGFIAVLYCNYIASVGVIGSSMPILYCMCSILYMFCLIVFCCCIL